MASKIKSRVKLWLTTIDGRSKPELRFMPGRPRLASLSSFERGHRQWGPLMTTLFKTRARHLSFSVKLVVRIEVCKKVRLFRAGTWVHNLHAIVGRITFIFINYCRQWVQDICMNYVEEQDLSDSIPFTRACTCNEMSNILTNLFKRNSTRLFGRIFS